MQKALFTVGFIVAVIFMVYFLFQKQDFKLATTKIPQAEDASRDVASTSVTTQKATPQLAEAAAPSQIKSETDFTRRFGEGWLFKRNDNGKLSYISGSTIPNVGRSPASLKSFTNEISALLETPIEQIQKLPIEINKTDLSRTYHIPQTVEGLTVYQGQLTYHVRQSDDAVFMISNQLKNVGPFDKRLRYNLQQATTFLQNKYGNEIRKVDSTRGPVLFASAMSASEQAWVFIVSFKTPKLHQEEIVIGAETGVELHKENLNIR